MPDSSVTPDSPKGANSPSAARSRPVQRGLFDDLPEEDLSGDEGRTANPPVEAAAGKVPSSSQTGTTPEADTAGSQPLLTAPQLASHLPYSTTVLPPPRDFSGQSIIEEPESIPANLLAASEAFGLRNLSATFEFHEGAVLSARQFFESSRNFLLVIPPGVSPLLAPTLWLNPVIANGEKALVIVPSKEDAEETTKHLRATVSKGPRRIENLSPKKGDLAKEAKLESLGDTAKSVYVLTAESFRSVMHDIDLSSVRHVTFLGMPGRDGAGADTQVFTHLLGEKIRTAVLTTAPSRQVNDWDRVARDMRADLHYMRGASHRATIEDVPVHLDSNVSPEQREVIAVAAQKFQEQMLRRVLDTIETAMELSGGRGRKLARLLCENFFDARSFPDTGQSAAAVRKSLKELPFRVPLDRRTKPGEPLDSSFPEQEANRSGMAGLYEEVSTLMKGAKARDGFVNDKYQDLARNFYPAMHATYLYHALVTEGAVSVLCDIAENIMATRFGVSINPAKKIDRANWRERAYGSGAESSEALELYRTLLKQMGEGGDVFHAPDSPVQRFAGLLKANTTRDLGFTIDRSSRTSDAAQKKAFLKRYLAEAVEEVAALGMRWRNHAKEEVMFKNIAEYLQAVPAEDARLMIYTSDTHHARYLTHAIDARFPKGGLNPVMLVGEAHQSRSERQRSQNEFADGRSKILVTTDAGMLSPLTPSVDRIEAYVPGWDGVRRARLAAKLRHHSEQEASVASTPTGTRISRAQGNIYVAVGTCDEASARRARREYDAILREYRQ